MLHRVSPANPPVRCAGVAGTALLAAMPAALAAQAIPSPPPGFAAPAVFVEASFGGSVRGCVDAPPHGVVAALRNVVELRPDLVQRTAILTLATGIDVAFVAIDPFTGRVLAGELASGRVHSVDPATLATASFGGVANTFDAIAIGADELLVSANPTWPAPGAASGVWHLGAGRAPRELLRLIGPSGPLAIDADGNLLVAEIGAVVPPPPGAVRLLRVRGAALQRALGGGAALSMNDIDAIGGGWNGAYDLAVDDLNRVHVSDPASSVVLHSAPGAFTPTGTTIDVGAAYSGLHLQFAAHAGAPFRPFQPPEHAPALFIGASNWVRYELLRLEPARPQLDVQPGPAVGPGPLQLAVHAGPASGFALLAATFGGAVPERVVASLEGVPIWLALPFGAPIAVQGFALDAGGNGGLALLHPGGFFATVDFQAVALGAPGSAAFGSTPLQSVLLLP